MFHSHPRDKIYLAIIKYTYEEKGKRDGHVSGLNPDTLRRAHNLKGHAVADKSHTFIVDKNHAAKPHFQTLAPPVILVRWTVSEVLKQVIRVNFVFSKQLTLHGLAGRAPDKSPAASRWQPTANKLTNKLRNSQTHQTPRQQWRHDSSCLGLRFSVVPFHQIKRHWVAFFFYLCAVLIGFGLISPPCHCVGLASRCSPPTTRPNTCASGGQETPNCPLVWMRATWDERLLTAILLSREFSCPLPTACWDMLQQKWYEYAQIWQPTTCTLPAPPVNSDTRYPCIDRKLKTNNWSFTPPDSAVRGVRMWLDLFF